MSPDASEAITQLELENKNLKTKVASLEHTQEFLERSLVGLRRELSENKGTLNAANGTQNARGRGACRLKKNSRSHSSPLSHLGVFITFLVKAALALHIVARLGLIIERSFVQ